jgi:hypothetical protein
VGSFPEYRLCQGKAEGERSVSKPRSKWKNRPDGKTVLRNSVAEFFASRPVELLASPAMRALSRTEHLALMRIEIELRQHAGRCNGGLIVTKPQFIEFGVHPRLVAPALRALEALAIVVIQHGRGGNAEHRAPNRFMLNYLCGAIDGHEMVTNGWKRFKTLEEAEQVAMAARNEKDPHKVAYGRRNASKETISQVHKVALASGAQSDPENGKFSGAQSGPTGPGAQSDPTIDTLGRGWGRGRVISEEARARHEPERWRDHEPDVIDLPAFLPLRAAQCWHR